MFENGEKYSGQGGKKAPIPRTAKTFKLRDYIQTCHRHIHFETNDVSGQIVATIMELKTNRLVRKIVLDDSFASSRCQS